MNGAEGKLVELTLHDDMEVNDYSTGFIVYAGAIGATLLAGSYQAKRVSVSEGTFLMIIHPQTKKQVGLPENIWRSYNNPNAGKKRVEIKETPSASATKRPPKGYSRQRRLLR